MARSLKKDLLLREAQAYEETRDSYLTLQKTFHNLAFRYDTQLTEEYKRPWRDYPAIEELKLDRDEQLIKSDEARRHAKRFHRKAKWTRWKAGLIRG